MDESECSTVPKNKECLLTKTVFTCELRSGLSNCKVYVQESGCKAAGCNFSYTGCVDSNTVKCSSKTLS